eukprot:6185406-Pleurochrysis_carterae.AAC.2
MSSEIANRGVVKDGVMRARYWAVERPCAQHARMAVHLKSAPFSSRSSLCESLVPLRTSVASQNRFGARCDGVAGRRLRQVAPVLATRSVQQLDPRAHHVENDGEGRIGLDGQRVGVRARDAVALAKGAEREQCRRVAGVVE